MTSGLKPSRTEAACWTVAVENGGGALRAASRRSQESTSQRWVLHQAMADSAKAGSLRRWLSGCPFHSRRRAVKGGGEPGFSSFAERIR